MIEVSKENNGKTVTFIYVGEDVRTFPTLGITVTKNDVFEAPETFVANNVEKSKTKAKPAQEAGE